MRKRQLYKRAMILSLAAAMTAGSATTAFAGQWQQDARGWRFQTGANTYHTNGWQWLDGNGDGISECYYFGPDAYMAAATTTPDGYTVNADGAWTENGVVKTRDDRIAVPNGTWICGEGANAGRWWWKNSDGSYPKSEWKWLDGNNDGIAECYYFDADGWCVLNGTTPDGFTVNADGAWMVGGTAVKRPAKHGSAGGPGGGTGTSTASKGSSGGGGGGSSHGSGGGSSSGGSSSSGSSSSGGNSGGSGSGGSSSGSNTNTSYVHDENYGNLGKMTSSEWAETKAAILTFKDENIADDMTDFEKEMKIIQWLSENCVYEQSEDWTMATAYSCIISGKAMCDGYADAFLQTAKLCGLTVKFVERPGHSFNAIKLDGHWYWVDVTFADKEHAGNSVPGGSATGSIPVGATFIECGAVNMTDDQVKNVEGSRDKYSVSLSATATTYDRNAVYDYYKYGLIPGHNDQKIAEADAAVETTIASYKADGKLAVDYTTVDETVAKIVTYLSDRIDHKQANYGICVVFANEADAKNASNIASKVNKQINAKYSSKGISWASGMKFTLPEENYYTTKKLAYTNGTIPYGKNAVGYTIRFVYDGSEISSVTGTTTKNQVIEDWNIPDGYEMDKVEVTSGSGSVLSGGTILSASEDGTVFTVTLKKSGTDDSKKDDTPVTEPNYTIRFVCNGTQVGEEKTGYAKPNTWVEYGIPEGYKYKEMSVDSAKGSGNGTQFILYQSGVVFTVELYRLDDAAEEYCYTTRYMYNGQLVAELNGTGKPNATIYIRQFETMDGKVYVPVGNGTAGCYVAKLTKNNMVFEIETTLQEQDSVVKQVTAAQANKENRDEAVKAENVGTTEGSDEEIKEVADALTDTEADAEEEDTEETSGKAEEYETDDMQEESGVTDTAEIIQ